MWENADAIYLLTLTSFNSGMFIYLESIINFIRLIGDKILITLLLAQLEPCNFVFTTFMTPCAVGVGHSGLSGTISLLAFLIM
jgi:hypothetical protein